MAGPVWGVDSFVWGVDSFLWGEGVEPPTESITPETNFRSPSLEVSTLQLAQHLPQGRAWNNKNNPDANLHKLIRSLATAFNRVQQQIEAVANEFNIPLSTDLLPEWEKSVGLPDDCQGLGQTLAERREAVINRLRRLPIVTKADFEALGEQLSGTETIVTPGAEVDDPITEESRFKLYVTFPQESLGFVYDFPVVFGGFRPDIVQCVFDKVVPASVIVILT